MIIFRLFSIGAFIQSFISRLNEINQGNIGSYSYPLLIVSAIGMTAYTVSIIFMLVQFALVIRQKKKKTEDGSMSSSVDG